MTAQADLTRQLRINGRGTWPPHLTQRCLHCGLGVSRFGGRSRPVPPTLQPCAQVGSSILPTQRSCYVRRRTPDPYLQFRRQHNRPAAIAPPCCFHPLGHLLRQFPWSRLRITTAILLSATNTSKSFIPALRRQTRFPDQSDVARNSAWGVRILAQWRSRPIHHGQSKAHPVVRSG